MITQHQVNSQLNIVILKHFVNYKMFCKMFFFSSRINLKKIYKYIISYYLLHLSTNRLFRVIANIHVRKFRFSKRKASLRSVPVSFPLSTVNCVRLRFRLLL